MPTLTLDGGSAVMLQFRYVLEDRRLKVARAFRALGSSSQAKSLEALGTDVLRFLAHDDRPKPWWRRSPFRRAPRLFEKSYDGLEDINLSVVDYRSLGLKPAALKRGVRIVARPVNGPLCRAVGSADGELDMIFWKLKPEAWREFFLALERNPDDPFTGCPTWMQLMPKADPEYDFFQPLNFT